MGIIKSLIKSGNKIMYVEDNVWKELVGATIPTEDDYVSKGMTTLDTITKELWTELGKVKIEILSYTVDDTAKDWFVSMDTKPFSPLDILNKEIKFDVLHYEEGRSENPILEVGYKDIVPPIYGVEIDENNSNPETAVVYTNDAVGFTPMRGNNGVFQWGSWEQIFNSLEIKPCVVRNPQKTVNYYLNPNDYTKKLNGSPSDITSGTDGDVMLEFPKLYWKMWKVGTKQYVQWSTKMFDGAKCPAHTVGSEEKDKIYLPAYMGNTVSGKLRSLSGKTPTVNQTIGTFRSQAQANGEGYQQMGYYPLLMLQVLGTVFFKSRDSQIALGRGYVDGNSTSIAAGGTNKKGMFYGETTGKQQNKFCGIEDFWGNVYYWIDGLYSDGSRNIMLSKQDVFNDNGSGYVNHGRGTSANIGGYIDSIQGGTDTGFIIKSSSGSATTHYSDNGSLSGGSLPVFGGSWINRSIAGAFRLNVNDSASYSSSYFGARLCVL